MDHLSKSMHYQAARNQPARSIKKRYETAPYVDNMTSQDQKYQKTLRWNIEENVKTLKNNDFTASSINLNQPSFAKYQNKENKYDDYLNVLKKKSNGLKSHKTINYDYDLKDNNFSRKDYPAIDLKDFKPSLNKSTRNIQYSNNFQLEYHVKSPAKHEITVKEGLTASRSIIAFKSQKEMKGPIQSIKYSNRKEQKTYLELLKKYERPYQKYETKDVLMPSFVKSSKQIKDDVIKSNYKEKTYTQLTNTKLYSSVCHRQQDLKTKSEISKDLSKDNIKTKISLKDFQLGKCKGEGAFGKVFIAVHKATRMLVAIKQVPKQKIRYMMDQFITEIKIQMFLDHPNIVKLYGFFDDQTSFYIIMQYMQGGNIWTLIKHKKKLSEQETVQKLKQVCLGLKEMHENNILHRDIKPQNIVLTNDVCKLCDFGWAAVCTDRRTTYCGTLDYISPEIIGGQGYDDSVDIWCIGVLAYEMLCGKTPFYNINRQQTMKKIMKVNYEYPTEMSSKAKGFIDKILKKNPDERLQIKQVLKHQFLLQ